MRGEWGQEHPHLWKLDLGEKKERGIEVTTTERGEKTLTRTTPQRKRDPGNAQERVGKKRPLTLNLNSKIWEVHKHEQGVPRVSKRGQTFVTEEGG